ncbi:UDP-glycosyltransferase UGT5 [Halyomorpha halys]|uniref:UDP-glycosyltransferase UGT5 n=1 Tax=Halyomorpha halys TaxID=286706 RepID=UPI0006D514CF|nr:2-hydroxyacylsphingosine 1-beta-galactosyltransferase isoform X1 [Halyomorpha halys]XP_014292890.1 2-hydroxyacylsphingosine 1-beta-galactosyltransferase isoform X1 [Halyomorpha halys]XP_024215060.1 2-hydroxyacylsphingosine 1-beta-galactosyltransferase isoform X1 [Halyomorpha halys]
MKTALWIFNIFLAIGLTKTANILILLPLPLYSHTNTFLPVFKELAAGGHNITMVSPYPQKQTIPNWTDITIDISIFEQFMDETIKGFTNLNVYVFYFAFWKFCSNAMKLAYQDKSLQKLIHSEELNYDLVILEPYFAQESLIAFGHKLNVPVIGLHPLSLSPWAAYLTGNEFSLTLSPNYRSGYTSNMTLAQRFDNTLINLIEFFTAYFLYLPMQENLMEDYMVYPGSKSRPPILAMLRNISLTLMDYHHSVGYVHPLQPNTIPVGGLSLKHATELPKDLKDIIEESNSTVIYLSFGSHVRDVSAKVLKALLEAFEELDHRVLMKWENENIPNKPKNVEIRKWFPQPSVLAHPSVQLFISHGGLHGTTEASFFGVPILGIPFFSDQEFNLKFVEQAGTGLTLLQKEVCKESLLKAIHELLNNPCYREAALKRSRIVNDRPHSALESAVYWIEYVLRHNGAIHLRPASLDLSIYQFLLLDIILLFLFLVVIVGLFIILSIKFLLLLMKVKKNRSNKKLV